MGDHRSDPSPRWQHRSVLNYYRYWLGHLLTLVFLRHTGTTIVNWIWFRNPFAFKPGQITPFFYLTFPLNLAQNVLTTGLISWKIYRQHRETVNSGLQISAGLNLVGVIRIIVESAMVYTVETALIIILFFLNHPSVVIVQGALCPSTGELFFCLWSSFPSSLSCPRRPISLKLR